MLILVKTTTDGSFWRASHNCDSSSLSFAIYFGSWPFLSRHFLFCTSFSTNFLLCFAQYCCHCLYGRLLTFQFQNTLLMFIWVWMEVCAWERVCLGGLSSVAIDMPSSDTCPDLRKVLRGLIQPDYDRIEVQSNFVTCRRQKRTSECWCCCCFTMDRNLCTIHSVPDKMARQLNKRKILQKLWQQFPTLCMFTQAGSRFYRWCFDSLHFVNHDYRLRCHGRCRRRPWHHTHSFEEK